ncbi:hypothetical protein, partial [Gibbsiella quercinecans]|uniref:hypothetical protein n=1 Tax=Gibbsiella quercinecans TaxID=929813 RepID=UPI0011C3F8D3
MNASHSLNTEPNDGWMKEGNWKVWSLTDFRHHCAQYGMHKAPSDWRLHSMKYTPVGVDIAKHLIQVHFINEHTG